jgi:hypothetical protein
MQTVYLFLMLLYWKGRKISHDGGLFVSRDGWMSYTGIGIGTGVRWIIIEMRIEGRVSNGFLSFSLQGSGVSESGLRSQI